MHQVTYQKKRIHGIVVSAYHMLGSYGASDESGSIVKVLVKMGASSIEAGSEGAKSGTRSRPGNYRHATGVVGPVQQDRSVGNRQELIDRLAGTSPMSVIIND